VRAGESISWNSKSNQLYWTLGPELYQADVDSQYLKKNTQTKPSIINLGFTEKADVPRGTVAFVGGKVITMENDQVIDKGVVIVKDNHIVAVGDANTANPKDAQVIDISGKSIMPGLFDAHAHGAQADDEIVPQQNWALYSGLSLGVTTIHDPSNDTTEIFAASEQQKAGNIVGPRIFSTGTILYGANAPGYTSHIDSLNDAKFHLERLKKVGAFSVKSYNQPRRNQRQHVIAGVLPFMLESGDSVDVEMYEQAKIIYGKHLLENVVLKNARLKRYDGSGITTEKTKSGQLKQWDRKAHNLFLNILNEIEVHEKWYKE
jgi:hypothetical protein